MAESYRVHLKQPQIRRPGQSNSHGMHSLTGFWQGHRLDFE